MLGRAIEFTVDHLVIGGGVVGLAVAARLASQGKTLLVEKNSRFGEETSSRNSEVIHAGLYYPNDSLKMKTCLKGRQMLYDLCTRYNIPHKKIGKWIFASTQDEIPKLHQLKTNADINGVPLRFLSQDEIKRGEPHLKALEVLESPETGIIDSHHYMNFLANRITQLNGDLVCHTRVAAIEQCGDSDRGYIIQTQGNGECVFLAKSVVNSAGLYADKIAQMVMGSKFPAEYKIYYAKGHYFAYSGPSLVSRLIYPVPEKNIRSLGIHATLDLAGKLKFGPDVKYQDTPDDYSIDENLRDKFYENIRRYLPAIEKDRLYPDYAGIRPKLSGPEGPFRDFVIQEESTRGFPNFINLVGIESPGLTSSLAIAELVAKLLGYKEQDTVP